ncbi:LysR family transcriptional regulator [Shimia sp. R9_3]|uniref:LysR family transcriptional regulator n=1 Tax=Shimia sp. R9_3 TaxID=2821113 RepID=UPI001ADA6D14|nr:LysR family transcriptional regulator [Shimia sp. R9_3]MBO9402604.1 LysR family transcriptional regulator [Shimia sp. R9_3]
MDRLQTLEVFVAVAEEESFAAGARRLGLSAPSTTRGVNTLEARLGTPLFTRTTRRVRLTEVGHTYLEDARHILAQMQAADDAATGAATNPVGQLRITCPTEFGRIYVAPILTDFLDLFPAVSADVLMVDRVVNMVEEGFDLAVRIGDLPSSGLTAVRVGQVRRMVVAAPEYLACYGMPQTPADLPQHQILTAAPVSPTTEWRFGRELQDGVKIKPRLTLSSVAAAISVAQSGWGLCRVLSYQVAADLQSGALQAVLEEHEPAPLPIHLVHAEGRRAPAKIRAFIDMARDRLRAVPGLA